MPRNAQDTSAVAFKTEQTLDSKDANKQAEVSNQIPNSPSFVQDKGILMNPMSTGQMELSTIIQTNSQDKVSTATATVPAPAALKSKLLQPSILRISAPRHLDYNSLLRAFDMLALEVEVLRRKAHGRDELEYQILEEQNEKLKEIVIALHSKSENWEKLDTRMQLKVKLQESAEQIQRYEATIEEMKSKIQRLEQSIEDNSSMVLEIESLKQKMQAQNFENISLMGEMISLEEEHSQCKNQIEELSNEVKKMHQFNEQRRRNADRQGAGKQNIH
jgi:DNA repair exonuclease SbcCD ATPase subunit